MEITDFDLMARLANGDDLALNALMDRWGERVMAFLHKMTGQHEIATDIAQETFVKLYQARLRYRPEGGFSTYLFAIATNLARNHARWKSRHPTVSLDASEPDGDCTLPEVADMSQNPGEAAERAEKIRAVHEGFLQLPPDLRETMTLFIYEGMGYAEIAAICGCSAKAVETRIYRARQILKERLREFAG
jgi:RNA polymerase sigma-70 factor (ECF subfamily)